MTQTSSATAKVRGNGVLTLGIIAALLSFTGVPNAKTLADVTQWGVPELAARIGMYAAPVLVLVVAMLIGRALGARLSTGLRWVVYGVLGALSGFFLAMCLDLFAGLPPLIERVVGPLAEPEVLDILLWSFAGFNAAMGAMMTAISILGRPGLTAFQVEDVDPECLDVRRSERAVFGWTAFGMLTLGVACAALAVAHQVDIAARFAPVVIALVSGFASVLANYALWRGFDELQRRQVVNGYAVSAVAVTLGAFVWSALQSLDLAPAVDATGVFLSLIVVQLVAMLYVTAALMGTKSMLGAPA